MMENRWLTIETPISTTIDYWTIQTTWSIGNGIRSEIEEEPFWEPKSEFSADIPINPLDRFFYSDETIEEPAKVS